MRMVPPRPGDLVRHESDYTDLSRGTKTPPRSWRARRDAGVVRQAFDYSCGAAALATLLSGAGDPVAEREILNDVLAGLSDEDKVHTMEAGLSLLDLRDAAKRRGYRAEGYRVPPDVLPKLTRPVIIFIQPRGYRHFAVLRGMRGDRVFLADPARGNVRYPMWRFLEMWRDQPGQEKGVIFVIDADTSTSPILKLASQGPSQPEILGARQLLGIRRPSIRLPRVQ